MEARVTGYSQVERLRERMDQAEVRHGQEIRADLPGIRVTGLHRNWFSPKGQQKGDILFCTMGPIRVRKVMGSGDGLPLPTKVVVEGLGVPREGMYDVFDALVQCNGDLRLIVDDATRIVPVVTERPVITEGPIDWVGTHTC